MKNNIFNKLVICALFIAGGLTSCDYLDVVPMEQPDIDDASRKPELTLGYLYSCYNGLYKWNPVDYYNEDVSSTDEYVLPPNWNGNAYNIQTNQRSSATGGDWTWRYCGYDPIRQCFLFLEALEKAPGLTDAQRTTWEAEAKFLIAYYHFMVLRKYGPCPIMDHAYPPSTMPNEMPGRSHFDVVVNYIVRMMDEAIPNLPDRWTEGDWGRADKVIAKAMKARVLLTAASPQWNGNTLYESGKMKWENTKWETEGYGKQLVSPEYSEQKWIDARNACEDALNFALAQGLSLYNNSDFDELDDLPANFTDEQRDFMKYVLRMRYALLSRANATGKCQEVVWGIAPQGSILMGSLPRRMFMMTDNNWKDGWSGVSPTLNAVQMFYTKNGKLPAEDAEFYPQNEWYNLAGSRIVENEPSYAGGLDADEIIKLNTMREPRFYAWLAFNGGEMGTKLVGGKPMTLYFRDAELQGWRNERDYCYTGYLCQKWVHPSLSFTISNGSDNSGTYSSPRPLMRVAELYLNLAECEAALNHTDACLKAINPVRQRAGIPALKESDITASKSATDWVRNERFIEFYGEGIRFYDVRRWLEGKKYFNGPYLGMNMAEVQNPTLEQFNKPVVISQYEEVEWDDRLYLMPLYFNEVDKSDTMIQAPGY